MDKRSFNLISDISCGLARCQAFGLRVMVDSVVLNAELKNRLTVE